MQVLSGIVGLLVVWDADGGFAGEGLGQVRSAVERHGAAAGGFHEQRRAASSELGDRAVRAGV